VPAAIVAVAAAVRLLYLVSLGDYVPISDAHQYHDLAHNISEGHGLAMTFPSLDLHPTAFRPPLYPYVLAVTLSVFGFEALPGQLLNLALGLVVVVLTYTLGRRLGGDRVGVVAALAVALYPPLVANDVVLLTEPLSLVLLLAAVLALTARRWAWTGVLTGLLVLTRPSAQFLVVVFAAWALWRLGWRRAVGLLAVTAMVVAPWIVRNWVQLDAPVYVTSNGFNLAAMYSGPAQEDRQFVDPVFDVRFDDTALLRWDEVAWSEELQRRGLQGIRDNPRYVARVVRDNVVRYLELDPVANEPAERSDGRNLDVRRATLPVFYVVTVVGWFGLLVHLRRPDVVLVIGVALYFAASSLAFIAVPRLRAPFDLVCCLGVGVAYGWWRDRRAARHPERAPASDHGAGAPSAADGARAGEGVRAPTRP
jgi:4-amino-4-deoxy-L-arabinose transferase-like glycosyltransferase